jgi:hypothetical protein
MPTIVSSTQLPASQCVIGLVLRCAIISSMYVWRACLTKKRRFLYTCKLRYIYLEAY